MEPSRSYANSNENLSGYHGEMRGFLIFSSEVERILCCRWLDHHDTSAAHQLVGKYLPLASKIVEGYVACGIPSEELIGEGYVGLMRAVCQFDPGRGVCFTTYAAWRVREAIHEHIVRTMGMTLFQMAKFCTL